MGRRHFDHREGIVGLPLEAPGDSVLTLRASGETGAYDAVCVYAAVNARSPSEVVRIDLFAELLGITSHVASAFLTTGFRGPAILASGFLADCWHVYACATSPLVVMKAAIQSCECSVAGAAIDVPADLSYFPAAFSPLTPQQAAAMIDPPMSPFGIG